MLLNAKIREQIMLTCYSLHLIFANILFKQAYPKIVTLPKYVLSPFPLGVVILILQKKLVHPFIVASDWTLAQNFWNPMQICSLSNATMI